MEIARQEGSNNSIISYDDTSILVAGKNLVFPCFVDSKIFKNIDNLENATHNLNCELLIVGSKTNYPIKEQVKIKQIVNTEFMNIASAIYSFNLMLSDGRSVVLIII